MPKIPLMTLFFALLDVFFFVKMHQCTIHQMQQTYHSLSKLISGIEYGRFKEDFLYVGSAKLQLIEKYKRMFSTSKIAV